jgi:hypothetical protein
MGGQLFVVDIPAKFHRGGADLLPNREDFGDSSDAQNGFFYTDICFPPVACFDPDTNQIPAEL